MQLKHKQLLQPGLFINNEWLQAASGKDFEVYNPATNKLIITVADAAAEDAARAITAADNAFKSWSIMPTNDRAAILKKWYQFIIDNTDDLALLLTTEQGKPLAEAKAEIKYGASFISWFAEECRRTYGETIPAPVTDRRFFTIKQPVGVVAAITPWNFPVAMVTRKIAPAIAAGCSVVLKPAEDTPLCALALAQLAKEAGLPAGVFNVIPTSNPKEIGKILSTHERIRKISFTGSTAVGKQLIQQAATTVKKMSMELGGNAPNIVFDDADIEVAVKGTIATKYRNAGQTCVCANRIFIQRNIYEAFIKKYLEAVKALKIGNGAEEGVVIGPLINKKAIDKVDRLVADAISKGAEVLTGAKHVTQGELFYEPSVITNCTAAMELSQEEIFGPVSAVYIFETEEEAIQLANDTAYGLAAYFFAKDINRVWRVAEKLQYGMIGINEGIISFAEVPFGGIKQSGFGKEGSFYGMEEYMITKYICLGGL